MICTYIRIKKRYILTYVSLLLTFFFACYYFTEYEKYTSPPVTRLGSNAYKKDQPQGVVQALDHGCYLQTSNFSQHQHSEELLAERNCRKKMPVALILGAALSGSATLKSALSFHPDVTVPEFTVPLNFTDIGPFLAKIPYSLPHQITVGESQEYLYMTDISKQMVTPVFPGLKVIILIRDPVARAMSEFLTLKSNSCSEVYRQSISKHLHLLVGTSRYDPHEVVKERSWTGKNSQLYETSPDDMHYNLEDTFQETVLESAQIDPVHFLVQRSIYGSGIRKWVRVIPLQNMLIIDAERFAKSPVETLKIVEHFLGLRPYYHKDFFSFDLPKGEFCFNSPLRSCVEPLPIQKPLPALSDEIVTLLRDFLLRSIKVQNKYANAYFPHLGENPLIYTPFR
ncbi:heparan sulfate glucosamine 3-O-sulfotransferase 1-like [Lytechinus variegatus]|uniref:heparan sulfate glucosamine 3-O-sulfotransferase 1-like n=1 Tax=Lytechinus variegatus TaxID=7654 RepID=UPI001BB0E9F4|nr:heparan sulfate glucosamine 3-O-sulfotransferase 1-like [Lytechinus variegatus]